MLLPYSIFRTSDRVVIKSGGTTDYSSAFGKLKDGEDIVLGEEIEVGSIIGADGYSFTRPDTAPAEVAPDDVRQWAGRILSHTDWMVVRMAETGEPMDPATQSYRQAVRDQVDVILAMTPIPADYQRPEYWPQAETNPTT